MALGQVRVQARVRVRVRVAEERRGLRRRRPKVRLVPARRAPVRQVRVRRAARAREQVLLGQPAQERPQEEVPLLRGSQERPAAKVVGAARPMRLPVGVQVRPESVARVGRVWEFAAHRPPLTVPRAGPEHGVRIKPRRPLSPRRHELWKSLREAAGAAGAAAAASRTQGALCRSSSNSAWARRSRRKR